MVFCGTSSRRASSSGVKCRPAVGAATAVSLGGAGAVVLAAPAVALFVAFLVLAVTAVLMVGVRETAACHRGGVDDA